MNFFEEGLILEKEGKNETALKKYELSILNGDVSAIVFFRAGLMCERLMNYEDATKYYKKATFLDPSKSEWFYRLGYVSHRICMNDLAKSSYENGIKKDPHAHQVYWEILETDLRWFIPRRRISHFLLKNIKLIQDNARRLSFSNNNKQFIFSYWAQGENNAPPIVKFCFQKSKELHGNKFVIIDDENFCYWVDIPEYIKTKIFQNKTAFSDVLRCALLAKYGGIWIDATCLCTKPLLPLENTEFGYDEFFVFSYHNARISSWFISCPFPCYISSLIYCALLAYWENHDSLICYYTFHHIFEILTYIDEDFSAFWKNRKKFPSETPHRIQKMMFNKDENTKLVIDTLNACFVHKLTYKYPKDKITSNSIIASLFKRLYV